MLNKLTDKSNVLQWEFHLHIYDGTVLLFQNIFYLILKLGILNVLIWDGTLNFSKDKRSNELIHSEVLLKHNA